MKYLDKTFSSGANSKEFRDNWDAIFGQPEKEEKPKKRAEKKVFHGGKLGPQKG